MNKTTGGNFNLFRDVLFPVFSLWEICWNSCSLLIYFYIGMFTEIFVNYFFLFKLSNANVNLIEVLVEHKIVNCSKMYQNYIQKFILKMPFLLWLSLLLSDNARLSLKFFIARATWFKFISEKVEACFKLNAFSSQSSTCQISHKSQYPSNNLRQNTGYVLFQD